MTKPRKAVARQISKRILESLIAGAITWCSWSAQAQQLSPLDLMKNLRDIAQTRSLLVDGFYTSENVRFYLGGTRTRWDRDTPQQRWGWVIDDTNKLTRSLDRGGSFTLERWTIRFMRNARNAGMELKRGHASIYLDAIEASSPLLTFESVIDVLGHGWQLNPDRRWYSHPPPRKFASHNMGNKSIRYDNYGGAERSSVIIYWHPDGSLETLILAQVDPN